VRFEDMQITSVPIAIVTEPLKPLKPLEPMELCPDSHRDGTFWSTFKH